MNREPSIFPSPMWSPCWLNEYPWVVSVLQEIEGENGQKEQSGHRHPLFQNIGLCG